jgi:phospholipase C
LPKSIKQPLCQPPKPSTPTSHSIRQVAITLGLILIALSLLTCAGPGPGNPPAANDLTAIQHTVFIIKENRTFDNYFGRFPGADGATSGMTSTGKVVPLSPTADCYEGSICNGWACAVQAFDNGKMDKFDLGTGTLGAYTQMTEAGIPNYWAYARRFTLGDHYFTSVHGPSFPNHLFTVGAQSGGAMDNVDNSTSGKNCDGSPSGLVSVMDANGNVTQQSPCFDFQTLPDLLEKNSISWKYYAEGGGVLTSIRHFVNGPLLKQRTADPSQFLSDAANGTLPSVSWILPPGNAGEHPPDGSCGGENWTVELLNTLMQGPDWKSTAIFIAWDDFGGLYDHLPPPQVDRMGLGPRAPLLIISPFAKRGYVSHTVYEQSSILKFVEQRYHLPALTARDRAASDMLDSFDFNQPPQPPPILSPRQCPPEPAGLVRPKSYTAYDND